ncbi:MAG: hypothetical protein GY814_06040 [Gammaproteobacteria bacterium]|nr:hypothetical protein [Gammaproteobacteria bacterium]
MSWLIGDRKLQAGGESTGRSAIYIEVGTGGAAFAVVIYPSDVVSAIIQPKMNAAMLA